MSHIYALTAALVALVIQGDGRGSTLHVACPASGVACGRSLQGALDAAPAGTVITLDAGKVYEATLTIKAPGDGVAARPVTITTRGWTDKGQGWAGLVTPGDKPRMAVLRGAVGTNAALAIENGPGAGRVTLVGLAFEATPPGGQGDIIRIGSGNETDAANVARHIAIRQVLLQGHREYGQKRGIAANGADVEISQVWCEEIFVPGQDSQCVAGWNGGHRVAIRHSYLAAASENILVGGATVGAAAMQPSDWIIEDVILHKPLRWQQDGRNRQVKNLLEFKHGRNLTARRVLAVNNWRAAQDGRGLLINYTTNGRCPECGNLENVLVEDMVMLNTDEGVSFQGHSWQPDSHTPGKLAGAVLRNVYVQLSKPGRVIQISNVLGRHNITVERSTFINHGPSWLVGSYGRAWRDDQTLVDGGPMKGLSLVDNVFAVNGEYGVTAPDRHHFGKGIGSFVDEDLLVAGNVIGGAPEAHLSNYNRARSTGEPNVSADRERLLARLPVRTCGEWSSGKGADCRRLQPVFELLGRLPEP
jgi:hypothetical protein